MELRMVCDGADRSLSFISFSLSLPLCLPFDFILKRKINKFNC